MKSAPGVKTEFKVFLDTSVLFSAVHSDTGGARQILRLGEAKVISLWVGPRVLEEVEAVLNRKSPRSKGLFALLLDRSGIQVGGPAHSRALDLSNSVIDYIPDARVVAEALTVKADYFVSFDREHLIGNPRAKDLPFPIGTAGDFLSWLREKLVVWERTDLD